MNMRFDSEVTSPPHQLQGDTPSTNTKNPSEGRDLELVDDDDDLQPSPLDQPTSAAPEQPPSRYPSRERREPARYQDYVRH